MFNLLPCSNYYAPLLPFAVLLLACPTSTSISTYTSSIHVQFQLLSTCYLLSFLDKESPCYIGIEERMNLGRREEQSLSIQEASRRYTSIIENNFERKENELVQQLTQQAHTLKLELAFFKKEVSHENIEKLITEKRREKERQRQQLEARWRECNEEYKTLEEQQKRLTNEQKENAFSVKNLEAKMEEFRVNILKMEKRVEHMHTDEPPFVTEIKENYQSPYKASSSPQAKTLERINKEQRLLTRTQEYFFTNKYNMSQSSPMKPNHQLLNCLKSSSQLDNFTPLKSHKSTKLSSSSQKFSRLKTSQPDDRLNLMQFLNNREVRLKIFRFIRKQL